MAGELLDAVFLGEDFTWDGAPLYISLHTAALNAASSQNTSEATYTGYARVAVPGGGASWLRAANVMSNQGPVVFPTNSGANQTVTYMGIGTAASGAGQLLYYGQLTASTIISTGTAPVFQNGAIDVTE